MVDIQDRSCWLMRERAGKKRGLAWSGLGLGLSGAWGALGVEHGPTQVRHTEPRPAGVIRLRLHSPALTLSCIPPCPLHESNCGLDTLVNQATCQSG